MATTPNAAATFNASPWESTEVQSTVEELITKLDAIRAYAEDLERRRRAHVGDVHPSYRASVRNLLHYVALRHFDIRPMQPVLASLGLSSLGRTESHTMASIDAVSAVLRRLRGGDTADQPGPISATRLAAGRQRLQANTESLLGAAAESRAVRIMVTLPTEAGGEPKFVRDLIVAGMDCVRINCAHDGPDTWAAMITNVRDARRELGRNCRILMDLAGPKLRTGLLEPGPKLLRWRPHRDVRGRVVSPARIWLAPPTVPPPPTSKADAVLPVTGALLEATHPGDAVRFVDARGKTRTLKVVGADGTGRWAESSQTAYVETGMVLLRLPNAERNDASAQATGLVGELPPREQPIVLEHDDILILHRHPSPGAPAQRDKHGLLLTPAHVACTLPQVFADARVGEPIVFDDGAITGVIRATSPEELHVEITQAPPGGAKLRADKSINLPQTALRPLGLTEKDLRDLEFVARHADLVGLSFVNDPRDVVELQNALEQRAAGHVGIVLKIETRRGFDELPWLLIAGMRRHPLGVMIARGDLAVECGWERMAEIQEEILWVCEASHVPVIWATQVLEQLAKSGVPSRAEITDAAMAERAECVMLNKGPHIGRAVSALDEILRRMQTHQMKKTSMLGSLKLSDALTITREHPIPAASQ